MPSSNAFDPTSHLARNSEVKL